MRYDSRTIDPGIQQPRRPVRISGVMILAALTFGGAGCTRPSDLSDENGAACVPNDPLAGEWIGEMTSASGSASRRIQATYRPTEEGTYLATYRTTVGLGLPLQFDTTHRVTQTDGILRIVECRVVDIPGVGTCHCRAVCTGLQLVIHYRTANDSGTIRLQRVTTGTRGSTPIDDLAVYVAAEWESAIQFAVR